MSNYVTVKRVKESSCSRCDGTGTIRETSERDCPDCNNGVHTTFCGDHEVCSRCDGTGRITETDSSRSCDASGCENGTVYSVEEVSVCDECGNESCICCSECGKKPSDCNCPSHICSRCGEYDCPGHSPN